jgi:CBS-domain-containing membrane protein
VQYQALIPQRMAVKVALCETERRSPKICSLDSPALDVMTDLKRQKAISVNSEKSISRAEQLMAQHGVHLLFVLNEVNSLVGLVTSEDVLGEKILKILHKQKLKFKNLVVEDIMTPKKEIEALSLTQLNRARVGDILETLSVYKRAHALVMDSQLSSGEKSFIRGIISLNQIIKQTGLEAIRYNSSILDYLNHKHQISSFPSSLNP